MPLVTLSPFSVSRQPNNHSTLLFKHVRSVRNNVSRPTLTESEHSSTSQNSSTSNPFSRPAHLGPSPPTRRPPTEAPPAYTPLPAYPLPAYTPSLQAYTGNMPPTSTSATLVADDRLSFLGQFNKSLTDLHPREQN